MSLALGKSFDVFDYVKKSKELGVMEELAEYQAKQIKHAVTTMSNTVKAEIKQELHVDILVIRQDIKDLKSNISERDSNIKSLELSSKENTKALAGEIKSLELSTKENTKALAAEIKSLELSTKEDTKALTAEIKSLEFSTKEDTKALAADIKSLEFSTKEDTKTIELSIKEVVKYLELSIEKTRTEIYKSKYEIVVWVAGLFVANGLFQHFFK